MAALVVETMSAHGIDVVLVGGSCVCIWTNERFGSLDLDFVDISYRRRREIAAALASIGFLTRGATRYFEHPESHWTIEFPSAPLAVGHEQIASKQVVSLSTAEGVIRLLSPTDTIKDRLLWFYLEGDRQCWVQAVDIASHHEVDWSDLKSWHSGEGYRDEFLLFQRAVMQ
jgi:hypothetical protein